MIEAPEEVLEATVFPGRQGRLAFVYLAAAPRRVERGELGDLLWPVELPDAWESSLNALVSKLRKVLERAGFDGNTALQSVHGAYEFRPPAGTWIDLRHAVNALDRAEGALMRGDQKAAWSDAASASAVFRRPFLSGESGPWIDRVRRELYEYQVRTFDVLAGALLADGQPDAAVRAARHAVDLAPFREACQARLMECLIASGNRAEAIKVYNELTNLLAAELGISPGSEVESLYLQALG